MAKTEVTIPLGHFTDVRVLKSEAGERGEIIITIESSKAGTSCRQSGKWITKLHGQDDWVTIRHLPVFRRPATCAIVPDGINVRIVKVIPRQPKDWMHDSNSPHSFAYDNHVLLQLVNSTVEDVSLKEGSPMKVWLGHWNGVLTPGWIGRW